ncbi:MAG TPA: hypothetical protein VK589_11860 [Chryseolinea sp.]|nr:hypothetical protein [Chryseolinea sp.]
MESKIEITLSNGNKAGDTLKELGKQANTLNKELRNLKPGTEEFIKKAADLRVVEGEMGKIKTQIKGTTQASDGLKGAFSGVLSQIPGFSMLSGILSRAKGGVGGLTSGFGLLKGAIASTGIGALVLIVGALINAFSKFTPLLDKVEQIFGGISAVVSELTQRLQALGSGLWDIITGTPGGLDKMASSFDGLTESITGAYNAGVELVKLQQDLDDLNRGIVLTNAKQEAQIDRLILQSKNRSLSLKEQNALLQEARKIAEENFTANNALDKKNLDALLLEAKQKSKLSDEEILQLAEGTLAQEIEYEKRGALQDDLLQKIVDAQVKVVDAEHKTNNQIEKIANREAAIREKQEAEREKATAEELKRIEEEKKSEEKALAEKEKAQEEYYDSLRVIEDAHIQAMDDSREKELLKLKTELQRQIESIDENAPFYAERVAAAQELARKQRNDVNEKWDKKEQEDTLANLELQLAESQNVLNEQFLNGQITQAEFATVSIENALQFERQKLEVIKAAHGERSAEYQKEYATYLSMQQDASDQAVDIKKQEMADQMAAMQGSLGTFGNFFSQIASLQKQGTAQWKAFATTSAILSAIQGAINAYTSTAAIPIVGGALAPIAAGLALAAGMANVRKIQSTKVEAPAKAERGMVLRGPSHAQGGIPIEAEGDEIILTKGVYRDPRLRRIASDINYAAGGRRFAAGGPVSPFESRPPIASGGSQSGVSALGSDRIEGLLMDNFKAMSNRIDNIKVINVVTETEEGIKTVNQIREDADV